jgi:hypothetical protein
MSTAEARQYLAEHDVTRRAEVLRDFLGRLESAAGESAVEMLLVHNPELAEIGKDIGDGAQPPADESTQPAGGPFERVTVILAGASSAALKAAAEATGDSKTDTINRAIQTYAMQVDIVADGGQVLIQHPATEQAEEGVREGESTQPALDADRVVAYRSTGGWILRCLDHAPTDLTHFVPVTSDDLEDGGICTDPDCGRDVLITPEPFVPRTEREYWVDIATALNAAAAAGMPVGINMEGILTDHNAWAVVWNREQERWEVGGYDDGLDAPAEPDVDEWVRCSSSRCPNGERRDKAVSRGWTADGRAGDWLCAEHAPTGFFRPGRTYTRQHHGSTVEFLVEYVSTPPGADHLIAFGWRRDADEGWVPSDSDDVECWTEVAEGGEPRG